MSIVHPRFGTEKYCPRCDQVQVIGQFKPDHKGRIFPRSWCITCRRAWAGEWRRRNKEKVSDQAADSSRRKLYGLRPADYARRLRLQGEVCAICGNPETKISRGRLCDLSVDHDHATGYIRGLLCSRCNAGLGGFRDNSDLLQAAIKYLEKSARDQTREKGDSGS